MTVEELIDTLSELPADADVMFRVNVHVGPSDNGGSDTYHMHVYSVEVDDDGDVILATG